jgi:hypothetical protein
MRKPIKVFSPVLWQALPLGQRSWVDVVHDRVERLRVNRWLVYLGLSLALVSLLHGLHWLSGALPLGHFTAPLVYTASVSVISVAFAHHLDDVARRSLERFRSALPNDEAGFEQLTRELTTMPAAPVLLCHAISLFLFSCIVFLDPTFYGLLRGYPLSDSALYLVGWLNNGMLLVNLYHTIHQLSWVQTTHARAQSISLIDRAPAFAFSTLTYRTAVLGSVLMYGFLYLFPALRIDPIALSLASIAALLMMAVFFLPLQGMHERLVEEKERRLSDVRQQIDATFTLLHSQRKASDLAAVEQMMKHLPALVMEEEYLSKLPTWPWPPGTVTRLMSVVLLPLFLWVAERMLGQLLP